ncbi:shikimate kinase [Candidatus Bathyarchaeota archaeon]|nr:shikimate kinase [Candidatus Bathyarchaeota archaeon]MBS7631329.1 shikimate kinase [Candidatus Bathyarchaeota archaeon]
MRIVLYGFMGVGKSVVGKILAESLQFGFIDTDEEIEKKAGIPIHLIFERFGEAKFRAIERDIVETVSSRDRVVIACGGGAVLNPMNVQMLKRSSFMVLLTSEPEVVLERISKDPIIRPLLSASDRLSRIKNLMSSRLDRYLELADLIIDTSNTTPEDAAREILEKIRGEEPWIL